jgi:Acetamidase/Formamidase family
VAASSPTASPTRTRRSGTSPGRSAPPGIFPGVEFTGITHPGLFGTAPSAELLARWNARERALIATDPDQVPPLALPPLEENALGGTASGDILAAIGRDGAGTVPASENGGNHDIKNFTRGSRVFYPVHVPGALFSGGDLHFSQGDGEITFCGAIEMGGFIDFHIDLIKGGMETYGVTTNPILGARGRGADVSDAVHVDRRPRSRSRREDGRSLQDGQRHSGGLRREARPVVRARPAADHRQGIGEAGFGSVTRQSAGRQLIAKVLPGPQTTAWPQHFEYPTVYGELDGGLDVVLLDARLTVFEEEPRRGPFSFKGANAFFLSVTA